jgi:6-phosphogluconolactonase
MSEVIIKTDAQAVARMAAWQTATYLRGVLKKNNQANWLLAGGTTPLAAYRLLVEEFADKIDWGKVFVAIGDERCVPLDSHQTNWREIVDTLLDPLNIPKQNRLSPQYNHNPEVMSLNYKKQLKKFVNAKNPIPHFDIAWLGMGEDGHTLSLFPDRSELDSTDITVAVYDSPKPPPNRISLTLSALSDCAKCLIIVSGAQKAVTLHAALKPKSVLPVAQAVAAIETHGGHVSWLVDKAAAQKLT